MCTEFICFLYLRWKNSCITCLGMCEFSLVYRPMNCIVIAIYSPMDYEALRKKVWKIRDQKWHKDAV
jgi:hypothetical protein